MNVRTIGYLSHIIFFRTFSIGRLTYGIICRYSEVIRVCFIIAYLGRSVSRNDQRARADRIKLGCSTATCQRAGAKVYGRLSELHFIWFTDDIFVSLANINDGFFSCHSNCCQWCLTCPKRSLSYSETAHRAHATPFDIWRKQPRHSFPRFPLIFGHCTVGLPSSTSGLQEDRSGALSSSSSGSTTRMHTTSTNWGSVCTAWNRQRDGRVVRMSQGLCAAEGGHFEQLLSRYQ